MKKVITMCWVIYGLLMPIRVGVVSVCLIFNVMFHVSAKALQEEPQGVSNPNYIDIYHFMTTPTVFSYHVMVRVTQSHLVGFISTAKAEGWQVGFLNLTEYTNLVHALTIRSSGFVTDGNRFIKDAALTETRYFSSPEGADARFGPFIRRVFERAFVGLEASGLSRFEEKPFVYLMDVTGDRENGIRSLRIEFQTSTGRFFSVMQQDQGQDLTPLLFPGSDQVNVFEEYPHIARHIDHGLWVSFQDVLSQHNIPKGQQVILYLKDLSPNQDVVQSWEDIQRINIGVLVEDEKGQIQDLDWLIAPDTYSLASPATGGQRWIDAHLAVAFHTTATVLARRVLFDKEVIAGEFASILPTLSVALYSQSIGYFPIALNFYKGQNRNVSREWFLSKMTVDVVDDVSQDMLPFGQSLPSLLYVYDNVETSRLTNQERGTFVTANQAVCIDLAYASQDQCINLLTLSQWEEWLGQLPSEQYNAFRREVRLRIGTAETLARKILARHADQWVRLTRLLLQRGQLEATDLQAFQNETPYQLKLPLEEYEDVPVNLSLPEALTALGASYLPVAYEVDVFYRSMSEAFAFTRSNRANPRITRITSKQETLDELKNIRIFDVALPYIRSIPLEGDFTTHYDHGLSPVYFEMLMSAFPEWR